ncbi:MAG: hypothetical protein CMI01_12490 [Oceanospirillaceae bacterium]|nr:hypothetical protein [Oceanospirillaceae bacterium]
MPKEQAAMDKWMFVVPLSLILLGGCASDGMQRYSEAPTAQRQVTDRQELDGNWTVYAIGPRAVDQRFSPRLAFGDLQRVGGDAGCNRFMGRFELDESGGLIVSDLKVTRRICPDAIMVQEALLLSRLKAVKIGRLTAEGDLLLYHDDQSLPIRLRPDLGARVSTANSGPASLSRG